MMQGRRRNVRHIFGRAQDTAIQRDWSTGTAAACIGTDVAAKNMRHKSLRLLIGELPADKMYLASLEDRLLECPL